MVFSIGIIILIFKILLKDELTSKHVPKENMEKHETELNCTEKLDGKTGFPTSEGKVGSRHPILNLVLSKHERKHEQHNYIRTNTSSFPY
jgi:hypothetical protein